MAKEDNEALQTYNMLARGTTVKGDLQTNGNLRIDGEFTGNLTLGGKLVIGESGRVTGDIQCASAEIEGQVKVGKMTVAGLLMLKKTSHVEGSVQVQKLGIEQGAFFAGQCDMSGERIIEK